MTPRELREATLALAKWFEQQDISDRDSIIVMAAYIPAVIQALSIKLNKDMKEGGESVVKMIMDNINQLIMLNDRPHTQ